MSINGDCPFYQNHLRDINHLFMRCCFAQENSNTIIDYCSILVRGNIGFINWSEYIWKYEKVYNKLYHRSLEKIFVIVWSIWINVNNSTFLNVNVQSAHTIN